VKSTDVKSLWRLLWPHLRTYRWIFLVVLLLGAASAFAQQSAVLLIKPVWEILFPTESPPDAGTMSWAADLKRSFSEIVLGGVEPDPDDLDQRRGLLMRVSAIIAAIAVFAAASSYAFSVIGRWVGLQIVVSLRGAIAQHLMGLSLRYHGQRKLGDLLSRVSQDVNRAMIVVNLGLRDLIQQPLRFVTALVAAYLLEPKVTLLVLIGIPILVLPVAQILKRVRRKSTESLQDMGASVQTLAQMFQGIRTVKAFRAEERELERYHKANLRWLRTAMKLARAGALTQTWTLLYTHLGLAAVLLSLGWLALGDPNSNGSDLAPFFIFISEAYSAVKSTTRAWGQVAEATGACERLQELLDEKPDIAQWGDASECAGLGAGIRFEGVSFAYPKGEDRALSGVDLQVNPGETLALVGPSGAGKSTLIDVVARFIDPTEGRVTVDGVDLRELSLDSWSRHFAMVTQVPFLFHASVGENIRYGKPDATNEDVRRAARAANILSLIERMPQGLNTDVNDFGSRLSGGERQRITIARAILHGGELLLLDEATSALDTESEAVVQAALDELMADRTVIVIAHRLSTVRNADRIAVLDQGALVELGTHTELLELNGVYARLYAMQFRE
jgi:ABC-type multidrug transport system fused ATPase/permease subunit